MGETLTTWDQLRVPKKTHTDPITSLVIRKGGEMGREAAREGKPA